MDDIVRSQENEVTYQEIEEPEIHIDDPAPYPTQAGNPAQPRGQTQQVGQFERPHTRSRGPAAELSQSW